MSGETLQYNRHTFVDLGDFIRSRGTTPQHRAFATHLLKIAEAIEALDKAMSGDTAEGTEIAAIDACLAPGDTLREVIKEARLAKFELVVELTKAGWGKDGREL